MGRCLSRKHTLEAGFLEPAREAGLAFDAGLAVLEAGFSALDGTLLAFDAGFFDSGFSRTFEVGLVVDSSFS